MVLQYPNCTACDRNIGVEADKLFKERTDLETRKKTMTDEKYEEEMTKIFKKYNFRKECCVNIVLGQREFFRLIEH